MSRFRYLDGKSDVFGGLATATVGATMLWEARRLPYGSLRAPDSGFFPLTLGVLLLSLGALLSFRSRRTISAKLEFTIRSWNVPLSFGAFLLYGLALERVGFVLCTTAILFAMMTMYGRIRWPIALAVSVGSVVLVYVGFVQIGVPLPSGLLSLS